MAGVILLLVVLAMSLMEHFMSQGSHRGVPLERELENGVGYRRRALRAMTQVSGKWVRKEFEMACACDGKVRGTPDKKCAHCREAIAHGIPAPRHNCSYGNCS